MPPIVINVPPASGPPWWITAFTALVAAALGVVLTNIGARSREHQRWLWEKRVEICTDLLDTISNIERVSETWEYYPTLFAQLPRKAIENECEGLHDKRLFVGPLIHDRIRSDLNALLDATSGMLAMHKENATSSELLGLRPHIREMDEAMTHIRYEIDRVIESPPPLLPMRRLKRHRFKLKQRRTTRRPAVLDQMTRAHRQPLCHPGSAAMRGWGWVPWGWRGESGVLFLVSVSS